MLKNIADSSHKLVDMLSEFQPDGMFFKYLSEDLQVSAGPPRPPTPQTINFSGFMQFVNCYFGAELPLDLTQQFFLSFAPAAEQGQAVLGLAMRRRFNQFVRPTS